MNAIFRLPGIMPKPGIIRIHAIQCKRTVHDAFEKWKTCSKLRKCTSASEKLCSGKSLMDEHATRVFFFFFSPVEYDNVYRIWDEHFDRAVRFVEQCRRLFQRTERSAVPTPSFGGPNAERCQRLCANGCVPRAYSDRVSVQLGQCAIENRQRLRSSATALGNRGKRVCMKINNVYASA